MEYVTTISSKGQITLPAAVRRSLNIRAGDRLNIVKRDDIITIKADTYEAELAELRVTIATHLKTKGLSNLSTAKIKKRAESARTEYLREKYGVRA
jgi:AbrB family looped-hinge helix DNA binding protein